MKKLLILLIVSSICLAHEESRSKPFYMVVRDYQREPSMNKWGAWMQDYNSIRPRLWTEWYFDGGWYVKPVVNKKVIVRTQIWENDVLKSWDTIEKTERTYGKLVKAYEPQQFYVPRLAQPIVPKITQPIVPPDPNESINMLNQMLVEDPNNAMFKGLIKLIQGE